MVFIAIFVIAGLVTAALWYLQTLAVAKRRRRMSEVAASHGLAFSAKDPFRMVVTLPLDFFDHGHSRKVSNVMYARTPDGRDVRAFDYEYTTGSRKNRHVYYHSCGLISTGAEWPRLTLGPEGFFERVRDVIGGAGIQFESEEFNRTWEVRSADPRFAAAMIDPEMMLFLMEKAEGAFNFEFISGDSLVPGSVAPAIEGRRVTTSLPAGWQTARHGHHGRSVRARDPRRSL